MKNGINQSGRMLPELEPTFVVPDERSLLELVQFTLEYAESVAYYDLEKRPIGNWRPFLLHDPIFIVGLIAATDLDEFKSIQEDLDIKWGGIGEPPAQIRREMSVNLLAMIKKLFYWEGLFDACHYSGPIVKEIRNGLQFLEPVISDSLKAQKKYSQNDFQAAGISLSYSGRSTENSIKENFKTAYKNLMYITEFAALRFEEMIKNPNGDLQPHLGLLIAGLRLFQEVQKDINTLTEKHLDFYYQRLLNQIPKHPFPIEVLAGLIPKPGAKYLPENSSFNLVFPSKKTVAMENPYASELSKGKIAELRTLYKSEYYPFSSGDKVGEFSLNTIYDQVLVKGDGKQEISFQGNQSSDFPFSLGEDLSKKSGQERALTSSQLGFVISSPVLLVESGIHFFKISIELSASSSRNFNNFISELLVSKERFMDQSLMPEDEEQKSFTHSFLNEAFTVFLSTSAGWTQLNYIQVEFVFTENLLIFRLEPEGDEELPFPFTAGIHGEQAESPWPSLRFLINNTAHYPPYKALSLFEIVTMEIHTLSKGVSNGFELYNQGGKLDSSAPFLPFGSLPTKDSYLKLYHPAVINRYLSRLSLNLTWLGLPEERNGFADYYKAYPEPITNQTFKGQVGINSDAYIENDEDSELDQEFSFFDEIEKPDGTYLSTKKGITLNLDLMDLSVLPVPTRLEKISQLPYLSIRIAAPKPFVFGHEQYTKVFADLSFYNSRFPKRKKDLPQPAYTPYLEKIEFTYSNYTKENFTRKSDGEQESIRFHHIFPFGYTQVFPASRSTGSRLVPQINGRGNLLIGLTDLEANQIINLGFKLHPAYFIHTITKAPAVRWEILEKNQWLALGNLILEDTTHGMLQSGIVKIKLPSILDDCNTRLSSGKVWLRVSNIGSKDINSRLMSLFVNAVLLVEKKGVEDIEMNFEEIHQSPQLLSNANSLLDGVLGPFHLKIPGLKKTPQQDRVRISEQTRHRGRGVSTWDIERLVLEHFPQIGRVMVYGRSDFPLQLVKNSNIQVVVIPHTPLLSKSREEGFRAPFELLNEIKRYLQKFISPFSRLEVSNPVFEKLKVRAAVQFRFINQAGYYRDKLEQELIEFLSPNPGDFQKEKGFIRAIYKAEIQNFIESRPYVESITAFSVLQIVEVQGKYKIIDTAENRRIERLRTISPYAILTSASSHQLEITNDLALKDPDLASIGDLSIDSDFIIHSVKPNKS
ncbi:hypothetical protein [Algoriphagus formosus]|uniref:Baseplate protein J-like domain-containing protein n=1 Tax=Algoriphagus formosus TaxID=2007308 RepID=A0A4R5VE26_9BACT|nr:hypothetical protein [Algoriphagus aquimaris]TDK50626.1 hypothetical protein E1898_00880 [Algoriphagus aquimaris]